MKKILLPVYIIFLISSCGSKSDDSSAKQKELELKAKELELKEKELKMNTSLESSKNDVQSEEIKSSNISNETSKMPSQMNQPRKKTEDDLRLELYNKECSNPLKYLSVDYSLNYKVFSGKDEIKGKIYNYASIAGFRDIVLEVQYKSESGSLLKTDYFGVDDFVYAGESVTFNFKTYSPQGTKIINVKVYEAKFIIQVA
jgi:hypothetical protein